MLSKDILENNKLNNKIIGKEIIFLDEVGSTNDECKIYGNKNFDEGLVVVTNNQTNGKGRLGRSWSSENKKGLCLSILLKPDIEIKYTSQLTLLAGLSVLKTLEKHLNTSLKIKWPNDIILNNKKICGILTEQTIEGNLLKYAVLGIGININNKFFDSSIINKATSLLMETGVLFNRSEILFSLLENFESYYLLFKKYSFKRISDEYKKNCITLNQTVKIINDKVETVATAIDVSNDGSLIVRLPDGNIKSIYSGEVSVRALDGYI